MDKTKLENLIKEASKKYYDGTPIMSDAEFDDLLEDLRAIDPTNVLLTGIGHGYIQTDLNTVKHRLAITRGLPKIKVEKDFNLPKGYLTPKYDGSSITLYYDDGKLIQAVTRGDGITGTDVTDKVKLVVPNTIDKDIKVITGEWLLSFENAAKYYPEAITIRNIATGILSKKIFTPDEIKRFDFVAYRINKINRRITREEILRTLRKNGFLTPDVNIFYNNIRFDELFSEFKTYSHRGKTFLYDGIVFDDGIEELSGEILYKNEVAYKIRTEVRTVTVDHIEWNHSKGGKLKPVVVFNPIKLSGATIQRATGFNAKNILDNGIDTGAKIKICRSGEVIPYIVNTIEPVKVNLPTHCQDCGESLIWSGVDLMCGNKDCSLNKYKTLFHYIKTISNIKGASSKVIDALIRFEGWKEVADIYKTKREDFIALYLENGLGNTSIDLVKQVFSKLYSDIDYNNWLIGLNIPNFSTKNVKKYGADIKEYLDTNDITKLGNLTDAIKTEIIKNTPYISEIYNLTKDILVIDDVATAAPTLKVCITGKLSIGRKLLLAEFAKKGIIEASIRSCDILICNEPSSSSKYVFATNNNIPIMTENDFMNKYF